MIPRLGLQAALVIWEWSRDVRLFPVRQDTQLERAFKRPVLLYLGAYSGTLLIDLLVG